MIPGQLHIKNYAYSYLKLVSTYVCTYYFVLQVAILAICICMYMCRISCNDGQILQNQLIRHASYFQIQEILI